MLLYLHAVVDVLHHREAFSVLHALPVLRRPLPGTHYPILALGGRDGEVLPGVGLGGDGVGLWMGRGGVILENKRYNTLFLTSGPDAPAPRVFVSLSSHMVRWNIPH